MKKIISFFLSAITFYSCENLDLDPPSEASSETWYSTAEEIRMSLNDLYRTYLWELEINLTTERMTDNWTQRQAVHVFSAGAINSEWATASSLWLNTYKGIARANTILNSLDRATDNLLEEQLKQFTAEASFFRAVFYSRLAFFFGDVPFYTEYIDIDAAFEMSRTDKEVVMQQAYEDFDTAISYLPESYPGNQLSGVTKGAALAFKARAALYMQDWEQARESARACMDLGIYELHPRYDDYFYSKTRNSAETIFALPQSTELGEFWTTTNFYTRTPGGSSVAQPSWELLASYLCTDGLPIDESPLFDPRNPFDNRDPRLHMTIAEFGTEHLGFIYDPNPYATEVLNVSTGNMVSNRDTRSVDIFASYNGLTLKKGVDEDWTDDNRSDFDIKIMRYADVLLMYAEASIELGETGQSTLEAINTVRARAYGVSAGDTGAYPAVTTTSQNELRKELRNERRVEFAWENRRLDDLLRWRLAEKVLIRPIYGMLDPNDLIERVIDPGLWFWPETPEIDEDGLPDFSSMYNNGYIKLLSERNFDTRQYLFPIPSKEILINNNLTQNPGY